MSTAFEKIRKGLIGHGSPESDLSLSDLRKIVEDALSEIGPGAKVLAIVPDKTRDDNTNLLFSFAAKYLGERKVEKFDALVAQGTHGAMSADEKRIKLGVGDGETIPGLGQVFDHHWSDPNELVQIGELSAERVTEITGGLYTKAIPLKINRLLAPESCAAWHLPPWANESSAPRRNIPRECRCRQFFRPGEPCGNSCRRRIR